MRKVTRKYTLYDYSELCEQAKKNARRVAVDDWCEQLQMDECPYDEKLIATFNKWLIDKVESLCYLLERKGYHDLYEPGEKDIKEMCEIYGLEFLCDGTMY